MQTPEEVQVDELLLGLRWQIGRKAKKERIRVARTLRKLWAIEWGTSHRLARQIVKGSLGLFQLVVQLEELGVTEIRRPTKMVGPTCHDHPNDGRAFGLTTRLGAFEVGLTCTGSVSAVEAA